MILKKYTVISPKGCVWEGTLVGQGGTITATAQDGRIVAGLHFKQLRDDGAVAEIGVSTAPAAPIVGAASQEPGAAVPLVSAGAQSLGSLPPTPVKEDVRVTGTAEGGTKAVIKTDPAVVAGGVLDPARILAPGASSPAGVVADAERRRLAADAPVNYDALTVAELTDLASQRKVDLGAARLKADIIALLK